MEQSHFLKINTCLSQHHLKISYPFLTVLKYCLYVSVLCPKVCSWPLHSILLVCQGLMLQLLFFLLFLTVTADIIWYIKLLDHWIFFMDFIAIKPPPFFSFNIFTLNSTLSIKLLSFLSFVFLTNRYLPTLFPLTSLCHLILIVCLFILSSIKNVLSTSYVPSVRH